MKIELFYDPVRPETAVKIDGLVTDTSDIYGFLYPVRNCLIQTWLHPRGSWPGLKHQLKELARGEKIELIFYGRKIDFIDIKTALDSFPELLLSFEDWNSERDIKLTFDNLDKQICKIFDDDNISDDGIRRKTGAELFPEFFSTINEIQNKPMPDWKVEINSNEDFMEADQNAGCCCIIKDSYLDSYDSLNSLEFLLRSMRRAPDMILCCIDDRSKFEDFSYYAQQFENLNFRLVMSDNNSWQKELLDKYGNPYIMRKKLSSYEQIKNIINKCINQKKELIDAKKKIERSGNVNIKEIRKAEQYRSKINWINRKEVYFNEFCTLITNDFSKAMAMKGDCGK